MSRWRLRLEALRTGWAPVCWPCFTEDNARVGWTRGESIRGWDE